MVDIIKRLCKEKGTSVAAIEKQCGLGNGSIRKWDNAAPSLDRAMAVANALGVSVAYLTGESEQKEKPTPEGELDMDAVKLLLSKMSVEELDEVILSAATEKSKKVVK